MWTVPDAFRRDSAFEKRIGKNRTSLSTAKSIETAATPDIGLDRGRHCITASLHHCITASLHHCITGRAMQEIERLDALAITMASEPSGA
jgi:hypothetical protein